MKRLKRWFTNIITYRTIYDLSGTQDYLKRWSLWLPFGLSIKIHEIVKPDDDRCEHDHPWWFIRIILAGGYTEKINGKSYVRKPWRPWTFWRIYPCLPSFRHRITKLTKKTSWSLVVCGKNRGYWGFYTKAGWLYWKKFVEMATTARVLWCDDGKVTIPEPDFECNCEDKRTCWMLYKTKHGLKRKPR